MYIPEKHNLVGPAVTEVMSFGQTDTKLVFNIDSDLQFKMGA